MTVVEELAALIEPLRSAEERVVRLRTELGEAEKVYDAIRKKAALIACNEGGDTGKGDKGGDAGKDDSGDGDSSTETKRRRPHGSIFARVIMAIEKIGQDTDCRTIAKASGLPTTSVGVVLARLTRQGTLKRVHRGIYRMNAPS